MHVLLRVLQFALLFHHLENEYGMEIASIKEF
jgi:hypothetical protein